MTLKKLALMLLLTTAAVFSFAQVPTDSIVVDTLLVDPTNPGAIIDNNFVQLLEGAFVLIFTFFSGLIPGLKNIKYKYFRAAILALIAATGFKMFGTSFINEGTFNFLLDGFFPGISGGILSWETFKFIFRLVGIDLKGFAPGPQPNTNS